MLLIISMVFLCLLKVITTYFCFVNKIKYVGCYLMSSIGLYLLSLLATQWWLLIPIYLAQGAIMMLCTGLAAKSKTFAYSSAVIFITATTACLLCSTEQLRPAIEAYYAVISIACVGMVASRLGKITVNQILFFILGLHTMAELVILRIFKDYNYVHLCNGIFLLLILYVSRLIPRYERLLSR